MARREIYSVPNPFWLSDTFIFSFEKNMGCYIFVKVNYENKIEEIGIDLEKRMHHTRFEDMKDVEEATKLERSIFNRIGDEYWWGLFNNVKRYGKY